MLFASVLAISEIDLPILPADENEALRMLAEGALDSSVWQKIEPYYTMPIRVPQGDLGILKELFPELPEKLPSAPDELSKYLPWDEEAVKTFLAYYPDLEPFTPILSFENSPLIPPTCQAGMAGFYFSRRGAADSGRQYALFSLGDPEHASAGGRIDFNDTYGRWFRRSLSAVPASGMSIAIGNFSPKFRTPLFSGYFPSAETQDTSLSDNWIYGKARTWNGASADIYLTADGQKGSPAEAEAFFHASPTEHIGQLDGCVRLSSRMSCFGGFSYLRIINKDNSLNNAGYFHTGFRLSSARAWECEIQSSVNCKEPASIPWQVTVTHNAKEASFNGTLIGIPRHYVAPRSETLRILQSRAKEDSVPGYLLNADLRFCRKLAWFLSCAPRLNCLLDNGRPCYCSSAIEFSGRSWCGYRLWYSWSPLLRNAESISSQQIIADCSFPLSKKLIVEASNRCLSRSGSYWSNRFRITAAVKANHTLELSPRFTIYGNSAGQLEKIAGIGQRLLFFKKTFSNITLEQKFPFSSWETIRAIGQMSFYF
jgi:hypothetical protein